MRNSFVQTRWLRVFVSIAAMLIVLGSSAAVASASRSIRDSGGSAILAPPAPPLENLSGHRSLRGSANVEVPQSYPSLPSSAPNPSAPAPVDPGSCRDGEEWAMLELINDYRAANGLAPLQMTQTLSKAAEFHSTDMASMNYFDHTLTSGASWSDNMTAFGYSYETYRAENIAAGDVTAAGTFQQWLNSPGHNANMLNPDFTAIGIGRASSDNSDFGTYWTTTFGGVVDAGAC